MNIFKKIRRWAIGVILSAVFIFGQHAIFAVKSPVFASFESRKPLDKCPPGRVDDA